MSSLQPVASQTDISISPFASLSVFRENIHSSALSRNSSKDSLLGTNLLSDVRPPPNFPVSNVHGIATNDFMSSPVHTRSSKAFESPGFSPIHLAYGNHMNNNFRGESMDKDKDKRENVEDSFNHGFGEEKSSVYLNEVIFFTPVNMNP